MALRIVVFTLLLLMSLATYANEYTFKYGLGIGAERQATISDIKYISMGIQQDLGLLFRTKYDLGYWNDVGNPHLARSSSGFFSTSVGLRVEVGFIYIENYWGLAWVFTPDSQLGIPFEFTEELGFGLQDNLGRFIGLEYRHFSNAGISLINKGRDFVLLNVGVPL